MLSAGYCNKIALLSFVIHNYILVIGYCYYLVNLIRYGLAQGDHQVVPAFCNLRS